MNNLQSLIYFTAATARFNYGSFHGGTIPAPPLPPTSGKVLASSQKFISALLHFSRARRGLRICQMDIEDDTRSHGDSGYSPAAGWSTGRSTAPFELPGPEGAARAWPGSRRERRLRSCGCSRQKHMRPRRTEVGRVSLLLITQARSSAFSSDLPV